MPTAIELQTITHVIGTDGVYTLTVRDSSGTVVPGLNSGLELDIKAYPGASTSTANESTVSASGHATTGVVTITFGDDDLLTTAPGAYVLYLTHTVSTTTTSYGPYVLILKPKGN